VPPEGACTSLIGAGRASIKGEAWPQHSDEGAGT
jgi:hypothetical protein